MPRRLAILLFAGACLLALAACGSDSSPTPQATGESAALEDVSSILELRAAFNADRGTPRLLLLLSPT